PGAVPKSRNHRGRLCVGSGSCGPRRLSPMRPSGAPTRWADRRNVIVVVVLGITIGGLYFLAIDLHDPTATFRQQQNVISGVAGSPYRYRVMVPLLLEVGTRALAFAGPPQAAFLAASLLYDCLGLAAQLLVLYALLRQFFAPTEALVGVAFAGGLTVMTLAYFTYQPWSILEVVLF